MNAGDQVITLLGKGIIVERESQDGYLSKRYKVKLDHFPAATYFRQLHASQGGLYFSEKEITMIKKKSTQFTLHY